MGKLDRIEKLENEIWMLKRRLDEQGCYIDVFKDKWGELDEIIESKMDGKMKIVVVENLASYQMGKAIKKDIDHIVEVFKIGGEK